MAATFAFDEDYGAATGSPAHGTSTATGVTNNDWSNSADPTVAYSTNPITAGNNSYDKWQFGHFSGTYNQILSGLWAHTAGALGTGLTLKGKVGLTYTTPATAANASLTTDMTSVIAIGSGAAVLFGATSPQAAGKAASTTSNPAYSQYLTTQLQTASNAAAGDITSVTLTLEYQEN
jgi:hypothetical protein